MAKITRTILTAFACAIFCSLCVAATAWADETGPIDANGKWIPGTYQDGTGVIADAHPGMSPDATISSSTGRPAGDAYYSHSVSAVWYASEDGQTNWTKISGSFWYEIPNVGEAGYESVAGHYLKAEVAHAYVLKSQCTSTGETGNIAFVTETEPAYVSPHENTTGAWISDGANHWRPCTSSSDSPCSYQIDHEVCGINPESAVWSLNDSHHWTSCSTCGSKYAAEKHTFNEFILAYVEENPMGLVGPTVHPTCDICNQTVTMSSTTFWQEYVLPSGLLGDAPEDNESDEPAEDATEDETAPEADAPSAEGATPPASSTESAAAPGDNTDNGNAANASQATFARTNDAAPTYLIGAFALMAGATALVAARKRLVA